MHAQLITGSDRPHTLKHIAAKTGKKKDWKNYKCINTTVHDCDIKRVRIGRDLKCKLEESVSGASHRDFMSSLKEIRKMITMK